MSPPRAVALDASAWPDRAGQSLQRDVLRFDLTILLLGLLVLLAWELGGLDLAVSRLYGTHSGFSWRDAWLTRALLHDGGRALGWCVMAFMVGRTLWRTDDAARRRQQGYWIGVTLLCLLLVPTIKRLTASSCPWDLAEFGGIAAYVPHWRLGVRDGGPGHCFPSGHAVAAFAFLPLYFEWRRWRPRLARVALAAVCIAGALYGWAQLARGAHYVSHTLWSAWLCWVVCTVAASRQSRRAAVRAPG
jgi:membrane-associated PAP2 superfamily phosphatase